MQIIKLKFSILDKIIELFWLNIQWTVHVHDTTIPCLISKKNSFLLSVGLFNRNGLELCSFFFANAFAVDIFIVPACFSSLLLPGTLFIITLMLSSSCFSSSFFTSSGDSNSSSEALFSLFSQWDSNSLSENVEMIPEKVNHGERDYIGA